MNYTYIALALLAALTSFGQVPYRPTEEEKEQIELVREIKEQRIDHASFLARAFKTKILFYGQVVDHAGMPVEGALVTYSPSADLGALDGRKAKYKLTSGKDGLFKIMTNGTDMYVSVEKEGYRRATVPRSDDVGEAIQAGERVGSQMKIQYFDMFGKPERNHHPEEKRPVQFTIRKIGELEQLKHLSGRFRGVKPDGSPYRISLDGEDGMDHFIEIICRSEYDRPVSLPGTPRRYDWSFEVKVDKGGIQELKDDGFEAPKEGYVPSLLMVKMPADEPRWHYRFPGDKYYYVRFDDGVCARFRVTQGGVVVNAKHEPYVILKSWLNPNPKSRNLETPE
jgi:hypothetical protein